MNKRWLSLSLALAAVWSVSAVNAAEELKVGDAAPEFELVGSDGKVYKLSDYKDKQAVVVAWFPKAFTGGCTKECQSFKANGAEIRKFDVAYFTASTDTAVDNKRFAESLELDYPILSDPSKKVAAAYGVINETRQVPFRWTYYIGPDGKILHIDKEVNAAEHGVDLAKKLKELGVAEKK